MSRSKKTYRLLHKTSINFLMMNIILLVLTAIALFIYTRVLLDDETEEELYSQVAFYEQHIQKGNSPISISPIIDIKIVATKTPTVLKDTMMYDARQKEIELYREISRTIKSSDRYYQIKIRTLIIESEDIFIGIIISFISVLLIAFVILFFINKSRNEKLWAPFFTSLNKLKSFSLESREPIIFESSNIEEFNDLNNRLNALISKINTDYSNLKQFTEDVSHEAQTPLAIMQAKIENIINKSDISDIQYEEFTSIQKDVKRLTQLNKRLIILAKIDNDQFSKPKTIDLKQLITERVEDFEDISENSFQIDHNSKTTIKMDPYLAEVLINNLLTNAIKYSPSKSTIHIKVDGAMVQVANSGAKMISNPDRLFERFYKENSNKKATGLGLSIVSKICSYYGFTCSYRFNEIGKQHVFQIDFI